MRLRQRTPTSTGKDRCNWASGRILSALALVGSLTAFGMPIGKLEACQICLPFPKTSMVDHLLEADQVSLARENPDKPFHLTAVEQLKDGDSGPPIDLFLDSTTRRILASKLNRKVICSFRAEGPEAGWKRIGTTNADVEPLVDEILRCAPAWQTKPEARARFFADLLDHPDDQIRTAAHIEVARAPYDQIKGFGGLLPKEQIRTFLSNFRYLEWHALYILLLAQSEDPADHQKIWQSLESAEQFSLTNQLAAWATAAIEVDREIALAFLVEHYLAASGRSTKELDAVFAAISIHGTRGHVGLRDQIVDAYRTSLRNHPELAQRIVLDLEAWDRWDLSPEVAQLLASTSTELDPVAALQLRAYLRHADESRTVKPGSPPETPANQTALIISALIALPVILVVMGGRKASSRADR